VSGVWETPTASEAQYTHLMDIPMKYLKAEVLQDGNAAGFCVKMRFFSMNVRVFSIFDVFNPRI
jgi:hypothetical protein